VIDDIVTRLREMWGDDDRCIWCKKHMDSQSSPHRSVCDLMEAADEIERLRAENDGLRIRILTLIRKLESEAKQ
jgi:hypothetical protein